MRTETQYLQDIVESCDRIVRYIDGITIDQFLGSPVIQDAVLYRTLVIGEAVRYLTHQTQAAMPEIPWKNVRRMRNIVVHDYVGVSLRIAWEVAKDRIPELKTAITNYISRGSTA
jgi:uncharacterized protein with HEPN domain